MRLFIRIKDGVPFEHPIMEENFRAAFPLIDPDNLPPEFAYFKRDTPPPTSPLDDPFEVYHADYVLNAVAAGGPVYEDKWRVREMTSEEKTEAVAEQIRVIEDTKERLLIQADEVIAASPKDADTTAWEEHRNKLAAMEVPANDEDKFRIIYPLPPLPKETADQLEEKPGSAPDAIA